VANPTVSPEAYTTYGMLSKYDWSPRFKAALMGSIEVESLDPKTKKSFEHTRKQKGGGTGYGLFQFERGYTDKKTGIYHKGQLDDYESFLKDHSLKDSKESQIDFVYKSMTTNGYDSKGNSKAPHEIGGTNRGMLQDAMKNQDINDSTESLMDDYFHSGVPHEDRRKKSSEKYRKAFKIKP